MTTQHAATSTESFYAALEARQNPGGNRPGGYQILSQRFTARLAVHAGTQPLWTRGLIHATT